MQNEQVRPARWRKWDHFPGRNVHAERMCRYFQDLDALYVEDNGPMNGPKYESLARRRGWW